MKKNLTLLLTSVGGLTGTYLAKHFKSTTNYRLIGVDMNDLISTVKWLDSFYLVPPTSDANYMDKILSIIISQNVDIIIPITSFDMDFYTSHKEFFDARGIKMLIMDNRIHSILSNKETCYSYLLNIGLKTPLIYSCIEDAEYPCVLKAKKSSGSKNTYILNNYEDYLYWAKKVNDYLLTEYLEGPEYTVDCLFNNEGICLGANVRERLKTSGGGAVITGNNHTIKIDNEIKKLESCKNIVGPVNFQFKLNKNSEICVFDFNTRFASGGLPLTVKSGFDIPNLLIDLLMGKKVNKWEISKDYYSLKMIRYYEEYYRFD